MAVHGNLPACNCSGKGGRTFPRITELGWPPDLIRETLDWWRFTFGANWRKPYGSQDYTLAIDDLEAMWHRKLFRVAGVTLCFSFGLLDS